MPSLISAEEWPVFTGYELTRNAEGASCLAPIEGATIRERINLMAPAVRHAALMEAMKLMERIGRSAEPDEDFSARLGLLKIREDLAPLYAAQFGLFGLGPSHLTRLVQRIEARPERTLFIRRQAGQLRWNAADKPEATATAPLIGALDAVALDSQLEPAASTAPPSWRPYCRAGVTEAAAFRQELGSDTWWAGCVDPLAELATALYELHSPSGLERRLADTFVDLSAVEGSRMIERSQVGWRSVSAMGALALDVLDGGLNGWDICAYELCREPFKLNRQGQKFCKESHRTGQWDLEQSRKRKASKRERSGASS